MLNMNEADVLDQLHELCAELRGSPEFYQVLIECVALHAIKSEDYTGDDDPFTNFAESAAFAGVDVGQAIDLHIGNKVSRIKHLRGREANNESIEDSYRDLLVYCGLRLAWARRLRCEQDGG